MAFYLPFPSVSTPFLQPLFTHAPTADCFKVYPYARYTRLLVGSQNGPHRFLPATVCLFFVYTTAALLIPLLSSLGRAGQTSYNADKSVLRTRETSDFAIELQR